MSSTQIKFLSVGLFFLFIFISGFRLGRSGKPYGTVVFTVHKLIGLSMGIYLIMTVYQIYQTTSITPIQIVMIVITVLLFIIIVAAGGIWSIEKPMPATAFFIHKIIPYLTVLSTGGTLYLLLR